MLGMETAEESKTGVDRTGDAGGSSSSSDPAHDRTRAIPMVSAKPSLLSSRKCAEDEQFVKQLCQSPDGTCLLTCFEPDRMSLFELGNLSTLPVCVLNDVRRLLD